MSRPRRSRRAVVAALVTLTALCAETAIAREVVWARLFPSEGFELTNGLALDGTENSYFVGEVSGALPGENSAGLDDAFVAGYDSDGNLRWSDQFGSPGPDRANGVAVDAAGNVYVVGGVRGALPGHALMGSVDAFVRKYDPTGAVLWTLQFGSADVHTEAEAVGVDDAGNVYVGGENLTEDSSVVSPADFLRKFDAGGSEIWTRQFGQRLPGSTVTGLTVTGGMVALAGAGPLSGAGPAECCTAYVKTFDLDGNELWTREFGPGRGTHVASNDAGRIALTGLVFGGGQNGGDETEFVRVFDSEGNEIWTREFGDMHDEAEGVAVDEAGNVYVADIRVDGDFAESGMARVRRFDADGTDAWTMLPDPAPPNSRATAIVAPPSGFVYVAGDADGDFAGQQSAGGTDAYVLKLNQIPTCIDTANPSGNEDGPVSAPVHGTVEPAVPEPISATVHEVNCTLIVELGL